MKCWHSIVVTVTMCVAMELVVAQEAVDLSGSWAFQLDEAKVGERERWFERELQDEIRLPGSTDERGFGVKAESPEEARLTREYRYVGPAW